MDEIWKDIDGYEGEYQISNLGRVKSLPKKCFNGKGYFIKAGRILKPIKSNGYLNVWLRKKIYKVHRLVAFAFIPTIDGKPQVNHKNGIRNDNRAENLEWVTDSENQIHGYRVLGRKRKIGKNHPLARRVLQIKDGVIIAKFNALADAQRETGIDHSGISMCCSGKIKQFKGFVWRYKEEG